MRKSIIDGGTVVISRWKPIAIALLIGGGTLGLGACTQAPAVTQTEVATGTALAVTLADAIAPTNKTVQQVLADGALVCAQIDSTTGKVIAGTAVAVLNAAGVPVSVTNQAPAVVAGACPVLTQPVPAPTGTTNLPTAAASALPAVS